MLVFLKRNCVKLYFSDALIYVSGQNDWQTEVSLDNWSSYYPDIVCWPAIINSEPWLLTLSLMHG